MKVSDIQQALFGYDSGHHLLASSIDLPVEAVQFLASATDLSGSAPPSGFDQAMTGLPLPGTEYYALFSTWLAREMPRPGCVWSHALLIPHGVLADISNLSGLSSLFARPTDSLLVRYEVPLQYLDKGWSPDLQLSIPYATRLVAALYGAPKASVLVRATNSRIFESLLFNIWEQQWPGLRKSFRFSTGSFSDRRQLGTIFDVQVAPVHQRGEWRNGESDLLPLDEFPDSTIEPWLEIAVRDLTNAEVGLRGFLRNCASDLPANRATFGKLADLYSRLQDVGPRNITASLQSVAATFPRPEQALSLKNSVLVAGGLNEQSPDIERLWQAFRALLATDGMSHAFANTAFDIAKMTEFLWPHKRQDMVSLLVQSNLSTKERHWRHFAETVAALASAVDLHWITKNEPDLIAALVAMNPSIAANPAVWSLEERSQWQVIAALESSELPSSTWKGIVRAMMSANSRVATAEVVRSAGPVAREAALEHTVLMGQLPPHEWRDALLSLNQRHLVDFSSSIDFAFAVALSPRQAFELWREAPDQEVERLADISLDNVPGVLAVPPAFLFVSIALAMDGSLAATLLGRGFFLTYEALSRQTEPLESWHVLQKRLPGFDWWEWDRCARLLDAVRNWLRGNRPFITQLEMAARNEGDRKVLERL